MNKRQVLTLCLVAVCVFTPVITSADSLTSVKRAILEKWDELDSMTAVLSATGEHPATPTLPKDYVFSGMGTVNYLRQYEAIYSRCEFRLLSPEIPRRCSVLWVINGKGEYVEGVFMNKITHAHKLEGSDKAFAAGGKPLFDFMEKYFDLKVLPENTVDSEPVYVIQGILKQPELMPGTDKYVFFFSQKTGVLSQMTINTVDLEKPVLTIKADNIKLNEPLSTDRFNYEPPVLPGAEDEAEAEVKTEVKAEPSDDLAEEIPANDAVEEKDSEPVTPEDTNTTDPLDPGPGIKSES